MAKITDAGGRPHSGLQPFPVVGIVTDNVDPDELGRIQVKFPTLADEPVSYWIRQISPNAGKERGLYALPEVDDEVMCLFMQGNVDTGVIVGQFWNGVDKPPTEAKDGLPGPSKTKVPGCTVSQDTFTDGTKDLEKNDRRFWRSRSGHLFVFDDSDGAETVQIWDQTHTLALVFDSAESRIVLSNTSGDIHIRTATDLYLEAGQNILWKAGQNIEGESGMDTTHKAGMNWTAEAGVNASLTGSVGTTIEGGTTLNLKGGATAKLEGGAMTQITGGVVTIN
jgi:uncharacterized protein involved in type VI secretion and phage assembly